MIIVVVVVVVVAIDFIAAQVQKEIPVMDSFIFFKLLMSR
jgi:hypothetical protein